MIQNIFIRFNEIYFFRNTSFNALFFNFKNIIKIYTYIILQKNFEQTIFLRTINTFTFNLSSDIYIGFCKIRKCDLFLHSRGMYQISSSNFYIYSLSKDIEIKRRHSTTTLVICFCVNEAPVDISSRWIVTCWIVSYTHVSSNFAW